MKTVRCVDVIRGRREVDEDNEGMSMLLAFL
jgi:hypothetical protein